MIMKKLNYLSRAKSIKSYFFTPLFIACMFFILQSCEKEENKKPTQENEIEDAGGEIQYGTMTDSRDGTVYETVTIGNQVWMAENLAYAPSSGNYWSYDNNNANVEVYGYLYDWETAQTVSPEGWHLPSDEEWAILIDYLGGEDAAGGKLKSTSGLWESPNTGATNSSGFSALPGSYRLTNGLFLYIGNYSHWWSSTVSNNWAWGLYLTFDNDNASLGTSHKENGFSVRCLKD